MKEPTFEIEGDELVIRVKLSRRGPYLSIPLARDTPLMRTANLKSTDLWARISIQRLSAEALARGVNA
jgi:hypothetical protein